MQLFVFSRLGVSFWMSDCKVRYYKPSKQHVIHMKINGSQTHFAAMPNLLTGSAVLDHPAAVLL